MNLLSNVFGHFFPPNTCSRLTCTRIPSEPCSFDTYILQLHTYLIDYIVRTCVTSAANFCVDLILSLHNFPFQDTNQSQKLR